MGPKISNSFKNNDMTLLFCKEGETRCKTISLFNDANPIQNAIDGKLVSDFILVSSDDKTVTQSSVIRIIFSHLNRYYYIRLLLLIM